MQLNHAGFLYIIFQFPYFPRRNPCDNTVIRHIFRDHCTGSNHYVVSNRHTRQDRAVSTDPDIVADHYWFCLTKMLPPSFWGERMVDGNNQCIWSDHHMVANVYGRNVQNCHIIIRQKFISDMDIFPAVAVEHRQYAGDSSGRTEQFPYGGLLCRLICRINCVQFLASSYGVELSGVDRQVPEIIFHACI